MALSKLQKHVLETERRKLHAAKRKMVDAELARDVVKMAGLALSLEHIASRLVILLADADRAG